MFLQDQTHCTMTKFNTLENKHKKLVFKELRRIWEKHDPELPWEKRFYNESNTLLLDDSPYKALLNPVSFCNPYFSNYGLLLCVSFIIFLANHYRHRYFNIITTFTSCSFPGVYCNIPLSIPVSGQQG